VTWPPWASYFAPSPGRRLVDIDLRCAWRGRRRRCRACRRHWRSGEDAGLRRRSCLSINVSRHWLCASSGRREELDADSFSDWVRRIARQPTTTCSDVLAEPDRRTRGAAFSQFVGRMCSRKPHVAARSAAARNEQLVPVKRPTRPANISPGALHRRSSPSRSPRRVAGRGS